MVYILGSALPYSLILFTRALKRYAFLTALALLAVVLFCVNQYIEGTISIPFFGSGSENSEPEVPDETVNVIEIRKGDTLGAILGREGLPAEDINKLIKLAVEAKIDSKLKIGQEITFEYNISLTENEDSDLNLEQRKLNRMSINIDKINSIEFVRENDNFIINNISTPLTKMVSKYEATIDTSVVASLKEVGLSANSIVELIGAYSHQVDFQRQIKAGDKITVITEKFVTQDSKFSHHGKILYASIQTQGHDYKIFRYSPNEAENNYQFFTDEGKSIKSNLLKTPVKVVRISSKYGHRKKHPVHGYEAMHRGVDFAGPVGTPIYAAGGGMVSFVGWKSGYGRFVVIKHSNNLSTAYAHASKFAKNLTVGSVVKQGDVIAYVGDSGDTTGPHLHFEVIVDGKQVDPMKFKSTPGKELKGKELTKFNEFKVQISRLSRKLNGDTELAAEDVKEIKLF
jgi:murein DD-endopeptidase MepM/ murein hydrolase activator NlpD